MDKMKYICIKDLQGGTFAVGCVETDISIDDLKYLKDEILEKIEELNNEEE